MNGPDYLNLLRLTGAEALVVLASLATLFVDLTVMRGQPRPARRLIAALIAALGCLAAGLYLARVPVAGADAGGLFLADPLTQLVKLILLGLTLLTVLLSVEADFTDHIGEYFTLLLLATAGLLFMAGAGDVLMIFLALELTSLSLYSLTALNKASPAGTEAALKYFFFGAMAAAFALFGFSLLYGLTGSTSLAGIAAGLKGRGFDPLLAVAVVMVLTGFGFKVAAVPFHLWAPDAYQGAPTPVAALIASGSKVAGFFLLGRFVLLALPDSAGSAAWRGFVPGWAPVLAVLAFASLLLGNLAALAQRDLKRLLAYSAVSHAGYLLLGVLAVAGSAGRADAFASLLFYAATYALTTVAAFAVAGYLERARGSAAITGLQGLGRRAPWFAAGLLVFLLSLAGLPPFAGFPAKFYVFAAALKVEPSGQALLWLVAAGLLLSPVALYYYLKALKQAYVVAGDGDGLPRPAWSEAVVVGLAAAGILLLGVFPECLLGPLVTAIRATGL
jgi:NADH-quinone oxidoreductase subunit N